jgi:hypothetical protein
MTTYFLLILTNVFSITQSLNNTKLPDTWEKDFTIKYTFGGSMDGSSTNLVFTYDSCSYQHNTGQTKPVLKKFALTVKDRETILKELKRLKADQIHSTPAIAAIYDGWNSSLQLGDMYVNGGTSASMSDHDKELYNEVCSFLVNFASAGKR